MKKPFKTLDEQIDILLSRNLQIKSKEHAKFLLMKNSYYSVINGYKDIFLMPKSSRDEEDVFEANTTLDDIVNLHNFDKALSNTILLALRMVEDTLSANIAYILAEKYGDEQRDYINPRVFKLGKRTSEGFERDVLLRKLNYICVKDEHPMKHYKRNYKNVPPWILVKGATFGNLVYIHRLFRKDDKNYLISRCLGIDEDQITEDLKEFFSKSLFIFRNFRNWAAHGGRLYSHRVKEELTYYSPAYEQFHFDKEAYKKGKGNGKNDIFALFVALTYFLRSDIFGFVDFSVTLRFEFKRYLDKHPKYYQRVLEAMGITENFPMYIDNTKFDHHFEFLQRLKVNDDLLLARS